MTNFARIPADPQLHYYTQGLTVKEVAKQLRRSEKSVYEWMNGGRKIPFWVPELLRLRHMEAQMKFRQMGIGDYKQKFGIASGTIITFKENKMGGSNVEIPDSNVIDVLRTGTGGNNL